MRFAEFLKLQEMAQSEGDPAKVRIDLDEFDRDFISQAVAKGVTPGAALKFRYEQLPQMKLTSDEPVQIGIPGPGGYMKKITIERPHYQSLIAKLRGLGLNNAAERGLQQISRADAKNWLDGKEDKTTGNKHFYLVVNHMKSRYQTADRFNKDQTNWGQKTAWEKIDQEWKATGKVNDQPGFEDVFEDVKQLVGKEIDPKVWEAFMDGVENKNYMRTIENVVASTLRQVEETDVIADRRTFKTVLRQVIAKMLIWGGHKANDPNHPMDIGKMVIEIPQWINRQSRIETSWVIRNWFNKRLDNYARAFQAGKEHDAADLADLGKQVVGRGAVAAPEDEIDTKNLNVAPQHDAQPQPRQQLTRAQFDADLARPKVTADMPTGSFRDFLKKRKQPQNQGM